jgi:hypothetical protein
MPRPALKRAARCQPAEAQAAIEAFLAAARQPVLQEPGEPAIPLRSGSFDLTQQNGALTISAWDHDRQLFRRISRVDHPQPGRLVLTIEKFGGRHGSLLLYDEARPQSLTLRKQADRHCFREQLRGMVRKHFPGWRVLELSADQDLEHSLSANYPRGLLRRGKQAIAFLGAAAGPAEPSHALTYALIWLDRLRRRQPDLFIDSLALFLPPAALTCTALRLRWLQGPQWLAFACTPEGQAVPVDLADHGNLHTALYAPQIRRSVPLHPDATEQGGKLYFRGLEVPACAPAEGPAVIAELARLRSFDARDRLHPLYTRQPEAWLETRIRAALSTLDATLESTPVYGQVTAVAGVDRGIADLLAVDTAGRLAVIEIKASEDIHLPLQALDYWMRVAHHAAADSFTAQGYFPGIALRSAAPRLLLAAPALAYHPTTETILRYFSSKIAVERIGLGIEWRHTLRVLFRLRGSERPA